MYHQSDQQSLQTTRTNYHDLKLPEREPIAVNEEFLRNLPIYEKLDEISTALLTEQQVVVRSPTGSGKTTGMSPYLASTLVPHATQQVVVLVHTRMLAEEMYRSVQELHPEFKGRVGWHGGDHALDLDAPLVFRTYGTAWAQLMQDKEALRKIENTTFVFDEFDVHSTQSDLTVGLLMGRGASAVLTSATGNFEEVSRFYNAYPVEVKERLHSYVLREPKASVAEDVVTFLEEGREGIIFVEGMADINRVVDELMQAGVGAHAEIVRLHSQVPREERCKAYQSRETLGLPKVVVATNIAGRGQNFPGVSFAVIDGTKKERWRDARGIEGLMSVPLSRDEVEQYAGRVCRWQEGQVVYRGATPLEKLPPHSTPEILRVDFSAELLRMTGKNVSLHEVKLPHLPPTEVIDKVRREHLYLGLTTEDGAITQLGRAVASLPLDLRIGLFALELRRMGVSVKDTALVGAILAQGGIVQRGREGVMEPLLGEPPSELFAQLKLLKLAENLSRKEQIELGLNAKVTKEALSHAREIRRALARGVGGASRVSVPDALQRAFLKAYPEQLFVVGRRGDATASLPDGSRVVATVPRESPLSASEGDLVVGVPFSLTARGSGRPFTLLRLMQKVTPELVAECIPSLDSDTKDLTYNPTEDSFEETREVKIGGSRFSWNTTTSRDAEVFARWVTSASFHPLSESLTAILEENHSLLKLLKEVDARYGDSLEALFSYEGYAGYIRDKLKGAGALKEIEDPSLLALPPIREELAYLLACRPTTLEIQGLGTREVKYQQDGRASITLRLDELKEWPDVIDAGVTLPDGETVRWTLLETGRSYGEATELREACSSEWERRQQAIRGSTVAIKDITAPVFEEVVAVNPFTKAPYERHGALDGIKNDTASIRWFSTKEEATSHWAMTEERLLRNAVEEEKASLLQSLPSLPQDAASLLPYVAYDNKISKRIDIPFLEARSIALYPIPVVGYWNNVSWEVFDDKGEAICERERVIERVIRPEVERRHNEIIDQVIDEVEAMKRIPIEGLTIHSLPKLERRDVSIPMIAEGTLELVEEKMSLYIAPTVKTCGGWNTRYEVAYSLFTDRGAAVESWREGAELLLPSQREITVDRKNLPEVEEYRTEMGDGEEFVFYTAPSRSDDKIFSDSFLNRAEAENALKETKEYLESSDGGLDLRAPGIQEKLGSLFKGRARATKRGR